MKVEYSWYNALFIDSKINQFLLVAQCNLWVGVLRWIRDLEWCPIKAVLGRRVFLVKRSFLGSWSNSNLTVLTTTFSKDEFLNSYFQNPSESSVMAYTSISFW